VYITGFGGRVMKPSPVAKYSVTVDGRRTSISLEDAFWNSLKEIAHERDETLTDLVASINAKRKFANLSSALRVFVIEYYRDQHERKISLVPDA
jgi:predicted DNA-binding ribbon-helix-helix protein